MMLEELKDKKIVILGFGKEGRDSFNFLKKIFPKKKIEVADQKFGKGYLKKLKDYEVVIKSPGIPFKILPKSALKKIVTQTDIFFDNCPGKIVGVTGTKGKSTTASMIYQILKAGGFKSHLIGNIGKPALNLLFSAKPENIYVYELSSHQLYNLKKSPEVAVFLNLYPEHLDYYKNFKEYARAKANITFHQNKDDYLVFNSRDKIIRQFAKKTKAKKIPIQANNFNGRNFSLPGSRQIFTNISIKKTILFRNIIAAAAVGRIFGISEKNIIKALKKFKPLPHRLELVGTFKGITFYNDSLATIPNATMTALENLGNKVETIILGGFERNIDFKNLAKEILNSKIKTLVLFPTTGKKIWNLIVRQNKKNKEMKHFFVNNMKEAINIAYNQTSKNKICLLSPASASFGIFRDYKERGELFKKYVRFFGRK